MKNPILVLILVMLFCAVSAAQTFTEIFEGGWRKGMNLSRPICIDLDNDGLIDMLVGTWDGSIHHFEQEAAGSLTFNLISEDFLGADAAGFAALCVEDFDNDNRLDLLVGNASNTIHHYEQDTPGSAAFSLVSTNFNEINKGSYLAPSFCDFDSDGLLDLVIGEPEGYLLHYKQDAVDFNVFHFSSDSLCGIDVGRNSVPHFTNINNNGLLDLIIGDRSGNIHLYEQHETDSDSFICVTETFNEIDVGTWSSPFCADLDGDGLLELIIGSVDGFLYLYEQDAAGSTEFNLVSTDLTPGLIDVGQSSAPFFTDLDNDGLLDMITGKYDGNVGHYEQDFAGAPGFSLVSGYFNNINVGLFSTVSGVDIDNDNLLDLIIGEWDGNLNHYEQNAEGSESFTLITETFNNIDVGANAAPCFTDIDNDGLWDLIIGEKDGNLNHYEQDESGSYDFTLVSEDLSGNTVTRKSAACFTDLDDDGLLDVIVGDSNNGLHHFEQEAAGSAVIVPVTDDFAGLGQIHEAKPVFADLNGDGLEDLIIGNLNGGIRYLQRNQDTAVKESNTKPGVFEVLPNYPNPFNPATTIRYSLPESAHVTVSIYNLMSQKINVLASRVMPAGLHTVLWDGQDMHGRSVESGMYICRIQAGEFMRSIKIMFVK